MDKIEKGIIIEAKGTIRKYGGSYMVAIPPSFIEDKGIVDPTSCKIFRNSQDQLIVELSQNENKGS